MKQFGILFLLIPTCIALFVVSAWGQESEPAYDGKTLTEWLTLYTSFLDSSARLEGQPEIETAEHRQHAAEHARAKEAVRQIGTNALPFFLKWIGQGETTQKEWEQSSAALAGFLILGLQAKAAI